MNNHPLAEKIQEHNKKYSENAELMFLSQNELIGLSEWSLTTQYPLIRDSENNPTSYWGLSIITVNDPYFEAAFFKKEDIQYAINNNLVDIKKFKAAEPHHTYVNPSVDIPVTNEFLTLKVPNTVKEAYQKILERQ